MVFQTEKGALTGMASGAVSGGVAGMLSTVGGAAANSFAYNLMSTSASNVASTVATGGKLDMGTLTGSFAGSIAGARIGFYKGVKGGNLANIGGELAFNTGKGAITGGISGGVSSMYHRGNFAEGFIQGAKGGAVSSGVSTVATLALMGPVRTQYTIQEKQMIECAYESDNVTQGLTVGDVSPVNRTGGLVELMQNLSGRGATGFSFGRNLIFDPRSESNTAEEIGHFFQFQKYGMGRYFNEITFEQLYDNLGGDAYNSAGFLENTVPTKF